ncbi:fe360cdc-be1b-49b7-a44a-8c826701a5eb [Sclerotinia trifoliorum]|uniref:Fe360cdc-be1b-49b7-a44a-8c826701a5eb n=1 Tax=Sclerotinia trifoliorum TaxID=28548 RepID=A0A8H2ZQV5_9HELO|nr:fe360cdc-be1b-49b7-a44a-8c826701a5eb [Sclerotinia trifoliorum]
MRTSFPSIINLSLVALIAAHGSSAKSTSCVSSYQQCLDDGGADNTCQSINAKCKNSCADSYGSCLSSSDTSSCMNSYNICLDDFTIFTTTQDSAGKDCASLFSACHDAGTPDNTCNSYAAQCKDKCSTIYATALTSGSPDTSAAKTQYNNCLDSLSVFSTRESSSSRDCVSQFSACRANGTDDNTCNSYTAQCKDKCSAIYGICLSSGSADDSLCMNQYNNCLDSFTVSTSLDCVSSFTSCRNEGGESNTCASESATCKNDASINYSTCLSSGNADGTACLEQYNSALVQFNTTTLLNNTSCVSRFTKCKNEGKEDSLCQSLNADCKTDCSTSYSTCLSSGDPALSSRCLEQYNFCLVTFAWDTTAAITGQDCVSEYMSSTGEDNARNYKAAHCKSGCSTSYSTCLSSGDKSLEAPCLTQYNLCLVDFKSSITKADCASSLLLCDEESNSCAANVASCKNTCSVALDICQSSGDPALTAPCQKQYQSCLVSFNAATAALKGDCVASFLSCRNNGGADNACSSDMASCKNKCSSVYDISSTSADNSTIAVSQALRLYDNCLVSFSMNDTIPTGKDCSSKYYACSLAGLQAPNACDSDHATCKNDCAVILDACRSSGDESLISMCDSLYNGCLDPVLNSNITTKEKAKINDTATYVLPTKPAFFNLTGAYSSIVGDAVPSAASIYISGVPATSTNGTGYYGQATSISKAASATGNVEISGSALPSAIVAPVYSNGTSASQASSTSTAATASSGYSLPVVTASASYSLTNTTSTSAIIIPTTSTLASAAMIEIKNSAGVDRSVADGTSDIDEEEEDDDACEI